jgi:hypothetical protein
MAALAQAYDSQGRALCHVLDYTGSTTHTDCSNAVTVTASVVEMFGDFAAGKCTSGALWGGTTATCSYTENAALVAPPTPPKCSNITFTATAAGLDN